MDAVGGLDVRVGIVLDTMGGNRGVDARREGGGDGGGLSCWLVEMVVRCLVVRDGH